MEILEFHQDRDLLKQREKEIVNSDLLKEEKCLNLKEGGYGGFYSIEAAKKGRRITNEILEKKYGLNFRIIINKNYRDRLTDEEKKAYYEKIKIGLKNSEFDFGSTFRNKKHTIETKKTIGFKNSMNQKGDKNSQFGTCWITNGFENKKIKQSEELPDGWILGRKI